MLEGICDLRESLKEAQVSRREIDYKFMNIRTSFDGSGEASRVDFVPAQRCGEAILS